MSNLNYGDRRVVFGWRFPLLKELLWCWFRLAPWQFVGDRSCVSSDAVPQHLLLVMAEVNRQQSVPSPAAQCMGQRVCHMRKPGAVADGESAIIIRVHTHPGFVFPLIYRGFCMVLPCCLTESPKVGPAAGAQTS